MPVRSAIAFLPPIMICQLLDFRLLCGLSSMCVQNLYLGRDARELLLGKLAPKYMWVSSWWALCIVNDMRVKFSASRAAQR